MSKVGPYVKDPAGGLYCEIRLLGGDKLVLSHDKVSLDSGRLTVDRAKWLGLGSERLCSIDLASPEGQGVLRRLTTGAAEGSPEATPLGALVEHLKGCRNTDEIRQRCQALTASGRAVA
jgi:hypothetical protein